MSSLNNNTIPLFSQEKLAKSHSFCFSIIPPSPPTPFIGSDNLYHFTYITICSVNSKFYIGKHTTTDFNDNYLGSGNRLLKALKKYGKQSFTRHIVQFYPTEKDAFIGEASLLTEEVIKVFKDELDMTYNLQSGGAGGTIYISNETRMKMSIASKEIQSRPEVKAKAKAKDTPLKQETIKKIKETLSRPEIKAKRVSRKGSTLTTEQKAKLVEVQNRPEVKAKIKEALKELHASPEYKEKMKKTSLEALAKKPLYLPNSTEIIEIHKDDILSKLKEGYRYAGKTAGIYNPNSNESKNIQFFSKHWKIKDPEAQNLNLIQHLESGWVFGWYNR
jgi:hypothetical protein